MVGADQIKEGATVCPSPCGFLKAGIACSISPADTRPSRLVYESATVSVVTTFSLPRDVRTPEGLHNDTGCLSSRARMLEVPEYSSRMRGKRCLLVPELQAKEEDRMYGAACPGPASHSVMSCRTRAASVNFDESGRAASSFTHGGAVWDRSG